MKMISNKDCFSVGGKIVRRFFILALFLAISAGAFVACSSENGEDPPPPPPSVNVNLSYSSYTVKRYGMDERHELTYYIIDTGVEGMNVAIIGGIHGNEPAGFNTAQDIVNNFPATFVKGKFLIILKANRLACTLNDRYPGARYTSGWSAETINYTTAMGYVDMNRIFPGNSSGNITERIAAVITEILDNFKPKLIFDLHESQNTYHYDDGGALGNSVIARSTYRAANEAAVAAINASTLTLSLYAEGGETKPKAFVSANASAAGMVSTTYSSRYNAPTFTLETTRHEDITPEIIVTLARRIEQQRFLINVIWKYYNP